MLCEGRSLSGPGLRLLARCGTDGLLGSKRVCVDAGVGRGVATAPSARAWRQPGVDAPVVVVDLSSLGLQFHAVAQVAREPCRESRPLR